MNYTYHRKTILLSRNEGKLKSYDSCFDLRAWSHDMSARDRYLREWMKCNMPPCLLPLSTLNNLLKSMSCRNIGQVAPRCHPDCKSKRILETICTSCQAMKDCLKNSEKMEHFFEEEELETGHWPCDKCLNALKSIRTFWKVILCKILKINTVPKAEVITREHRSSTDYINGVAKAWQRDIMEQAAYVKNLIPSLTTSSLTWRGHKCERHDETLLYPDDIHAHELAEINLKHKRSRIISRSQAIKEKATDFAATSTVKLLDIGCDPLHHADEKLTNYLTTLQDQLETQANEVEELKRENYSLKSKLLEVRKLQSRLSFHRPAIFNSVCDSNYDLKPLDTSSEENFSSPIQKENNSEVMITVKNYRTDDFKHVCMLQVVHKTNKSTENFAVEELRCCSKQDPIELLTKVQKTFGQIVRKEITIANKEHKCADRQDINVTFRKQIL
ncbi:PREDICTED: uncharacterized protein LOC106099810 [Papilio polytes]|uniref:uncharacterized protein LOC106099810 n=1 Tax=Papilio polytes TaxID=76194 RepID=UPI0006764AFD|nr:PREDICTED: uncharacterized protein LOC106099810 [Papilio polytes]